MTGMETVHAGIVEINGELFSSACLWSLELTRVLVWIIKTGSLYS